MALSAGIEPSKTSQEEQDNEKSREESDAAAATTSATPLSRLRRRQKQLEAKWKQKRSPLTKRLVSMFQKDEDANLKPGRKSSTQSDASNTTALADDDDDDEEDEDGDRNNLTMVSPSGLLISDSSQRAHSIESMEDDDAAKSKLFGVSSPSPLLLPASRTYFLASSYEYEATLLPEDHDTLPYYAGHTKTGGGATRQKRRQVGHSRTPPPPSSPTSSPKKSGSSTNDIPRMVISERMVLTNHDERRHTVNSGGAAVVLHDLEHPVSFYSSTPLSDVSSGANSNNAADCGNNNDMDCPSPRSTSSTSPRNKKTVYLVRHAESDENRRQQSLTRSLRTIGRLKVPAREDVEASIELVTDLPSQLDSDVSPRGLQQIGQVGDKLRRDLFLVSRGVRLVAHSPLRRARQTCHGMLGCVAPRNNGNKSHTTFELEDDDDDDDSGSNSDHLNGEEKEEYLTRRQEDNDAAATISASRSRSSSFGPEDRNDDDEYEEDESYDDEDSIDDGIIAPPDHNTLDEGATTFPVDRVVELPCLSERSPVEALPIHHDRFTDRIGAFESWLRRQPEESIAVVGHSHYFMIMLGLPFKFGNCDVWSVEFDCDAPIPTKSQLRAQVRASERRRRLKQMGIKGLTTKNYQHSSSSSSSALSDQIISAASSTGGGGNDPLSMAEFSTTPSSPTSSPVMASSSSKKSMDQRSRISDFNDGLCGTTATKRINLYRSISSPTASRDEYESRNHSNLPRGWSNLVNLYRFEQDEEQHQQQDVDVDEQVLPYLDVPPFMEVPEEISEEVDDDDDHHHHYVGLDIDSSVHLTTVH